MAAERKIQLPDMLLALDRRQAQWYNSLNEEQQKEFSPWVAMRFASSVDGPDYIQEHYLLTVNEFCNKNFSALGSKHNELHWMTLQLAGIGKKQLHPFIKPPKKQAQNKLAKWLSKKYPHLRDDEIELFIQVNSEDAIKDLAEQSGLDKKEIKELFS